ncbi:hypothetical protein SEA_RANDO14_2 [Mycobacterium phage Rando14]|uniref:Uncharacterized protein n=1 Tax=Mycobacterium phage Rando14 TaxID=2301556 RepID=A0A385D3Q9_9CAUD|nr:hypothetical protein I5G75_gp02 [Mycobacterium phage Rando14]AXQ53023.1 hypothetical protein SEA_RANDO14_2 [Mycobacterium phage Rando14]
MIAVVASRLDRAERLARELNIARAIPMSVRSILQGHGRGLTLDCVLVDESALPLRDEVRANLVPSLHVSGGRIHALHRVEQ